MTLIRDIFDKAVATNVKRNLETFTTLEDDFITISTEGDAAGQEPFWNNQWFPPLDAVSICGFLAKEKPARYIEVGSGNSTKFARWIINRLHLKTEIVSIDPSPRAEIDGLCNQIIRQPLEDVDSSFFSKITNNDILFLDNSHQSFQNSDVTVFFTEILPVLPRGTLFGLHDIFLPYDYPQNWGPRFYNEQYLMAAYLFGKGAAATIEFPGHFLVREYYKELLAQHLPKVNAMPLGLTASGALWMRK